MMVLELLDTWGRPVSAEVAFRRDTVEVRCRDRLVGVADRDRLREWFRAPAGVYAYDDMAWFPAGGGIALAIDNVVLAWPLADHVLDGLRARI